MYPDRSIMDLWNFFIGRPGTSASQCIDWRKEKIKVEVCCPNGKWGGTTGLLVPAGTRVRFTGTSYENTKLFFLQLTLQYLPLISNPCSN